VLNHGCGWNDNSTTNNDKWNNYIKYSNYSKCSTDCTWISLKAVVMGFSKWTCYNNRSGTLRGGVDTGVPMLFF